MTNVAAVIIPFRDRGTDPLRARNLDCVLDHWADAHGHTAFVVSDGRKGKELFNRHAAYNRGIRMALDELADYDAFIFAESDMLVPADQITEALRMACEHIGMVVPFSTYCYHSAQASERIRAGADPYVIKPMWKMDDCRSIGAINVLSRRTMDALGQWDEKFEGNWYDDDAMRLALEVLTGHTRFVPGSAHHLYHLPGHRGKHLTDKERDATRRNQTRLGMYEHAAEVNNASAIRRLLAGGS